MRLTFRTILAAVLLAGTCLTGPPQAAAQDSSIMMPEQSAAKAKQVLQQTIEALGGDAYLNVHDETCKGRLSQFGHSGDLNGFETFMDYAKPPTKDRNENIPKGNIIEVFNGDDGWVLDRGGVSDAPPGAVAQFQEDMKRDLNNILRNRIHEPNIILRYGGTDIVDLKEAEWVELVDSDDRTIRIALALSNHLPIRKTVATRDPKSRMPSEELEYYSNFHPVSGVQTPFQITREHNGRKTYQVFYDKCDYNTNVSDSLFTKESLEERWDKVGKKDKKKVEKEKAQSEANTGQPFVRSH